MTDFWKCNNLFLSPTSVPVLACQRTASFAATVRPVPLGRHARPCDRSAYAYTPSGRSPAHPASIGFGVLGLRRRNLPPMAPRVFVAPASGLGLAPAPRADVPVAFAAFRAAMLCRPDTASSPRDVLRRACDEPRRRVSLSSALDPSRRFLSSQAVRPFRSFLRGFAFGCAA